MYDFAFHKPATVADAVKMLGEDMEAKALAGGQTFIPVLKQRLNKPSSVIDDLHKLGLAGITVVARQDHHRRHDHAWRDHGQQADIQTRIPGLAKMASVDR